MFNEKQTSLKKKNKKKTTAVLTSTINQHSWMKYKHNNFSNKIEFHLNKYDKLL